MNKLIIWVLVGFIAVAILVGLGLSVGLFSADEEVLNYLTRPLVSLASGIIGAVYFSVLYRLYAGGRLLAVNLSIFSVALALILPVVHGTPEGAEDTLVAVLTYYLPGALVTELLLAPLLPHTLPYQLLLLFLFINISWVGWGLVWLGVGYLLEKPSKGISDGMSR